MSRPGPSKSPKKVSESRSVANTIREAIAYFFENDDKDPVATPVTDHTLRDIGVDPTVYDNLKRP